MPLECGVVATGGRAGKGGARSEGCDVVECTRGQLDERGEWEPGAGRHPLHLAHECHEMVGGDARSGVVGRPVLVGHLDGAPPEVCSHHGRGRVSRHGEPRPDEAAGTNLRRGERHERVETPPAVVSVEGTETEAAGEMDHRRIGVADERRRHLGNRSVGCGDDHDSGVGHCSHGVVVASHQRSNFPADTRQGRSQRTPGAAGTDDDESSVDVGRGALRGGGHPAILAGSPDGLTRR